MSLLLLGLLWIFSEQGFAQQFVRRPVNQNLNFSQEHKLSTLWDFEKGSNLHSLLFSFGPSPEPLLIRLCGRWNCTVESVPAEAQSAVTFYPLSEQMDDLKIMITPLKKTRMKSHSLLLKEIAVSFVQEATLVEQEIMPDLSTMDLPRKAENTPSFLGELMNMTRKINY